MVLGSALKISFRFLANMKWGCSEDIARYPVCFFVILVHRILFSALWGQPSIMLLGTQIYRNLLQKPSFFSFSFSFLESGEEICARVIVQIISILWWTVMCNWSCDWFLQPVCSQCASRTPAKAETTCLITFKWNLQNYTGSFFIYYIYAGHYAGLAWTGQLFCLLCTSDS